MLQLSAPEHIINSTIKLSGSKSIHNRLLILNEVLSLNLSFENKSTSEDTLLLEKAIHEIKNKNSGAININHAGTDMRFLTAYLATKEGEWLLTGSESLKKRPIGELVSALNSLGANISYLEKENFPPLLIKGKKLSGGKIEIDGSVSSQFISALLLISPTFENGLELSLKNDIVSWPYIQMTIDLLKEFGIKIQQSSINNQQSTILDLESLISNLQSTINNQQSTIYEIESDWSSASYWYSLVALSKNAEITLTGLNNNSSQADSVLPEIYKSFGVTSQFKNGNLVLTKNSIITKEFEFDFTNCPDIAQTIAVTCFALGIKTKLTGLKTLKLKESDRIVALKTELEKFGAQIEITDHSVKIQNTEYKIQDTRLMTKDSRLVTVNTHNDHRMAMSFAPLAMICKEIHIQNPEVVSKSYPTFWDDLKSVGFNVNLLS